MATTSTLQEIGKLQGTVDAIAQEVAKTNKLLLGNGQAGIYQRTIQLEACMMDLEENQKETSERHKEVLDGIATLSKSVGELKSSVEQHHNDKSCHTALGILLRKEVIIVLVLAIIFIISIVPQGFNLWEIVSNWLGI